jgi:hypothetical protein
LKERDVAELFLRDQMLSARALVALQMQELPPEIRFRASQAIAEGTGYAQLRTRIDNGETELHLIPTDGSAPMLLATTIGPSTA